MRVKEAFAVTLSDEALVHFARHFAPVLRRPEGMCPGEPEAADVIELLADRLEACHERGDA